MTTRTPHPGLRANLVLVGGRGCGKSSVAKRLSRRNRGFQLFSVDALVRYEAGGRSIPEIVEAEGWAGFRDREYAVIARLARFEGGALIDCGGGSVVDLDEAGEEIFSQRKVEALRRHGRVVYLQRDPEYLLARIGEDPERPALSRSRGFLEIMARREPWYRRAAHWVLPCDRLSKGEITDRVLGWFYEETGVEADGMLSRGCD